MALGPFYVAEKLKQPGGVRGVALLMRHGETPWNREGRVMGRNPVELDHHGRAQVAGVVDFVRALKPDLIVTSPLVRARQSAEIIAAGLGGGVPIREDQQIAEVQYGRWEGMTYEDLIVDEDYLRYREEPILSSTPGGENIVEVQARGVEAVMRTLGGGRRTARAVRLPRRYHPHRAVPLHGDGVAPLPPHPGRQRGALGGPGRRRLRRGQVPQYHPGHRTHIRRALSGKAGGGFAGRRGRRLARAAINPR